MPKVSVIIPCYNQAQYLTESLDSVRAQKYHDWECIIVNDGSPDNTEEVALEWCNKDPRFKYLKKENGGVSSARNAGIKKCTGEFILPLDADDLISEHYLGRAIRHFQNYPETKLVYCKAELFGGMQGEWKLPKYNYKRLLYENMIFCSTIYKKTDFDLTIGYNENMIHGFEDWDFWLNMLSETDIVYVIPEICFYYRINNKSRNNSLTDERIRQLTQQIVDNHKEIYENYLADYIWLNLKISDQQNTISNMENEISRIYGTKAYKIEKFILKPLTLFRKLIQNKYAVTIKNKG